MEDVSEVISWLFEGAHNAPAPHAQREAATRLVCSRLSEAGGVSSRDIARAGRSDTSTNLRVQIGRRHEPIFTD